MQAEYLFSEYRRLRHQTVSICEGLSPEDMVIQSMPDASPTKWHLAHTTWFFETFLLKSQIPQYGIFHSDFHFLFNSYYESEGERHNRPARGMLSRPSLAEVQDYRGYVDDHIERYADRLASDSRCLSILELGLHHEMQHQELMLTDVLHALSQNPTHPVIVNGQSEHTSQCLPAAYKRFEGGLVQIGHKEPSFSYDCERPRHKVWIEPYELCQQPVTNAQWCEFIKDGGYQNPLLWLSDGWHFSQKAKWQAPLYWHTKDGDWWCYGFNGLQPVEPNQPVCHISYYEADAFARWAGLRLPTEQEWEHAAQADELAPNEGNFLESLAWQPQAQSSSNMYGNVWEWTQSAYLPYPGFRPEPGAIGEYNGKFMVNQHVLRGGSCVTPKAQMRHSYRNFFYPHHRWQFMGLRLAKG